MEFWKNLTAVIQMVEVEVSSVMWFITVCVWGGGFPPDGFLSMAYNIIIFMAIIH
jgi:hypothetical protein